jgi:hypothetical protein
VKVAEDQWARLQFLSRITLKEFQYLQSSILGFSGLCCLDDFINNAPQNMGRLISSGVSP